MQNLKIFKNVISKKKQEKIKNLLLEDRIFPWYFINDVSASKQSRSGMQHEFCTIKKGVNSKYFDDVLPIIYFIKKPELNILRINSFLQFPNPSFKTYDTPHYDLPTRKDKYTVFLYYTLDSDGDTVFFDKNKKIIKRVTPKQGTAVMFDGRYLHTAYQPKKNIRCIINFNIDGSYEENIKYANS
tara:strand:+ start:185 stop:739 length:555 start_codon:yes stop_codon:yes gene_type:complete